MILLLGLFYVGLTIYKQKKRRNKMGLDMYLEIRNKKYTRDKYEKTYELKSDYDLKLYLQNKLNMIEKYKDDHAGYVKERYPHLKDADMLRKDNIFCGGGYYTGTKPEAYPDEDTNPKLQMKFNDYTEEEIIEMIYDNDLNRISNLLLDYGDANPFDDPLFYSKEVGYWRKANAIHRWFIDNATNSNNDWYAEPTKEELEALLLTCKEVLNDPNKARTLLPTQSGFFFGNTNYNEWYMEDIKKTIDILEDSIKLLGDDEYFVYIASY